jgi:hypothetical protein
VACAVAIALVGVELLAGRGSVGGTLSPTRAAWHVALLALAALLLGLADHGRRACG